MPTLEEDEDRGESPCGASQHHCNCRITTSHEVHECEYCLSQWRYENGQPVLVRLPQERAYGSYSGDFELSFLRAQDG